MILLDGDRLGELNRETIGVGPNNLAAGLIVLLPCKSQNDLIPGRRRNFAANEDPLGADVVYEFAMRFLVDHIIHRDHTLPSIIRTSTCHKYVTGKFHGDYPLP